MSEQIIIGLVHVPAKLAAFILSPLEPDMYHRVISFCCSFASICTAAACGMMKHVWLN